MKIRAKLKDVVILPREGDSYETEEIIRLNEMFANDPNAEIKIEGSIHTAGHGPMATSFEFYLEGIATKGIAKEENWQ